MCLHKNQDPSSFEPAQQFSISNGSQFAFVKMLKLHTEQKKINFVVSTVINNGNNNWMYLYENQDPSSFGPAKQFSINNRSQFALTKVL